MSEYSEILNDARWLPHGFGAATGTDSATISFIRVDRARLAEPAFLADAAAAPGAQPVAIPIDQIAAADFPQAPLHYIFHTAFCRSNLRALARGTPKNQPATPIRQNLSLPKSLAPTSPHSRRWRNAVMTKFRERGSHANFLHETLSFIDQYR